VFCVRVFAHKSRPSLSPSILIFPFFKSQLQLPACLLAGCLLGAGSCCGQTKDKIGTTGEEDKQATLL